MLTWKINEKGSNAMFVERTHESSYSRDAALLASKHIEILEPTLVEVQKLKAITKLKGRLVPDGPVKTWLVTPTTTYDFERVDPGSDGFAEVLHRAKFGEGSGSWEEGEVISPHPFLVAPGVEPVRVTTTVPEEIQVGSVVDEIKDQMATKRALESERRTIVWVDGSPILLPRGVSSEARVLEQITILNREGRIRRGNTIELTEVDMRTITPQFKWEGKP